MRHRGRRPLKLGHIQNLNGSQRAKQRMTTLLTTLQEGCTVPEACEKLNLSETHFHDLRHDWLQASLEALEPRRPGRRPHVPTEAEQRVAELEEEVKELQRELLLSRARCEVLEVTGLIRLAAKKGIRPS
jgi:molybdenum-dependent DNA-binding transcriptional regulator ModE